MINVSCVVLNSTYEPLSVVPSKRALTLCLKNKAVAVQNYEHKIHSLNCEYHLPATIALKKYVKTKRKIYTRKATLTQRNLFIRDNFECQYCGRKESEFTSKEFLTRDHIFPTTKGGLNTWENVVTSCSTCNNMKGDTLLENTNLVLRKKKVYNPTIFEIFVKSKMKYSSPEYMKSIEFLYS